MSRFAEATIPERRQRLDLMMSSSRPYWWASVHYSDHNPQLVHALWACYDELKRRDSRAVEVLYTESLARHTPD